VVTLPQLEGFLQRHKRIGLDTNILIDLIQGHSQFGPLAKRVFERIESGRNSGVCATLSLMEVLVQPYRLDDVSLVNQFYGLLTTYPCLSWVNLTADIADEAARLRARYDLKTPDAIIVASAILGEASGLIANDSTMKRITEVETLIWSGRGV